MKVSFAKTARPHTWASIQPHRHIEASLKSAAKKYDADFFGLMLPKPAFDIVKLLPQESLPDGTVRKAFETEERARKEDKLRVRHLRADGGRHEKYLAGLLAQAEKDEKPHPTLASAWWCREFRIRLLGEELRILWRYADHELFFVTLINRDWKIPVGQLRNFSALKIMESFRQHLNRSGTTRADGLLFSWLHGEYDPGSRCYRLHVHAVVVGDKMDGLRTLKGRWGYESVDNDLKRPVVFRRITQRARTLSYVHQSFWPNRPRYCAGQGARRHKSFERTRMPPTEHVEVLMWLFQQRPSDLLLSQPNIRLKRNRR